MDPVEAFKASKAGTWEEDYWRARMQRYYITMSGWRSRTPIRTRERAKAINMMYNKGWYWSFRTGWKPIPKETDRRSWGE